MTIVKWNKPYVSRPTGNQVFNSPFAGMLDNFFHDAFFGNDMAANMPSVNVYEENGKLSLDVSAPGFNKEDFKVEVEKGVLSISGSHKAEEEKNEKNFYRKEFNFGSFQRSFTLPEEYNEDSIEAKYESGILKLTIAKKQQVTETKKEVTVL